jgi:hypothetical protein
MKSSDSSLEKKKNDRLVMISAIKKVSIIKRLHMMSNVMIRCLFTLKTPIKIY